MEKIWLEKSYPEGVPHEIDPDTYSSLIEVFNKYTSKYSDKTAFINMGSSITYKELTEQSKDFAAYLQQDLGLVKGDKFAIMVPNVIQYPIALFGAIIAGLTVVNVNPLYTPRELEHQLKDSGAKAILVFENVAHVLSSVIERTPIEQVITTAIGDRLSFAKGKMINFVLRHVKKLVPAFSFKKSIKFNEAMAKGARLTHHEVDVSGEDLAFLQYTGGTTGLSKGVMLTHRNMIANIIQSRVNSAPLFEDGNELMVTALPLYHIFALNANCLSPMLYGASNLLITNPRDMPGFVKELSKHKFTAITGVNTLFNGLLHTPGFSDLNFDSLKMSFGGGMAVQGPVAKHWVEVTGNRLLEGYGLTECAPMVTACPYNQTEYNGSIGLPAASTDIKLVDDNGNEVPFGEPGEMLVKGPQVMKGYYNRPDATEEVLNDGWLATGDIATVDENGFFKIVDRKKDLIIVSGFNVYPNEVEEVLVSHEGVLEAAAISAPSDVTGEMVKVFIVLKDPNVTEKDILSFCHKNLTNYKCPKVVVFKDELPKSNVGKILRKELRQ
jgi:long-chain acyl-CoA synthetase